LKAKSFQIASADQLDAEIEKVTSEGFSPTLAFIFMGRAHDEHVVGRAFAERGVQVFGGNAWGEFVDDDILQGSIAVLLLDLDPSAFHLRLDHFSGGDEREISSRIGREAKKRFKNPAFLMMTSHLETRTEDIIEAFQDSVGEDVNIMGAGAGMEITNYDHCIFTDSSKSPRGMITLIVNEDRVSVKGRAICGWNPIGSSRTITRSDGHWVYEIDGQPALDAILKYIGLDDFGPGEVERWWREVNSLPIQLLREGGTPIMRPAMVYDWEERSVMCSGRMDEGSQIRFALEPGEEAIDDVIAGFKELKEEEAAEADALIYFSCMGRWLSFGPLMNREIREVRKIWDVPLAGFLSSGETGRLKGGNLELNAITSCCAVLKEVEE